MRYYLKLIVLFFAMISLAACGGGSSSSGGSTSGGGTPAPVMTDTLSLSTGAVSFSATQFEATPASVTVTATVSGSNTAGIVFGTPPGVDDLPPWLSVELGDFVGDTITGVLSVNTTDLTEGNNQFTVRVASFDANEAVLDTADVVISYDVAAGIPLSVAPESIDVLMHRASEPITEVISVTAGDYEWVAFSGVAGLDIDQGQGSQDLTLSIFPPVEELIDDNSLAFGVVDVFQNGNSNIAQFSINYTIVPTLENLGDEIFLNAIAGDADGGSVGVNLLGEGLDWSASADVPWLSFSEENGIIETDDLVPESPEGDDFVVFVDGTTLAAGRHSATITVTAAAEQTVNIPVTVEVAAPILTTSKRGFAFSDTPVGSILTASVDVGANIERIVDWTASSNASWLSVTPSGTTNDDVVIMADPAGLVNETTTEAVVTISSPDDDIDTLIDIHIGLWKSAVAPVDGPVSVGGFFSEDLIVADPIRPLAYVHSSETEIDIVHTYTGVIEKTFALTERVFNFDVSDDGAFLYLVRSGEDEGFIDVVDLDTQEVTTTFSYPFDRLSRQATQNIDFGRIINDPYVFMTSPLSANVPGVAVNASTGQVQTIVGQFPEGLDVQNSAFCFNSECFEFVSAGFDGARVSTVLKSSGSTQEGMSFLSQDASRLYVVESVQPAVYDTTDFSMRTGVSYPAEGFREFSALDSNDHLYVVLRNDGFVPTDPDEPLIDESRAIIVYDQDLNLVDEIAIPSEGGVNPFVRAFEVSGDGQRAIYFTEDFGSGAPEVRFITLD